MPPFLSTSKLSNMTTFGVREEVLRHVQQKPVSHCLMCDQILTVSHIRGLCSKCEHRLDMRDTTLHTLRMMRCAWDYEWPWTVPHADLMRNQPGIILKPGDEIPLATGRSLQGTLALGSVDDFCSTSTGFVDTVTHIFNCSPESTLNSRYHKWHELSTKNSVKILVPLLSSVNQSTSMTDYLDDNLIIEVLINCLTDGRIVGICCDDGRNLSAFVAMYVLLLLGFELRAAYLMIAGARGHILNGPSMCSQLAQTSEELRIERSFGSRPRIRLLPPPRERTICQKH